MESPEECPLPTTTSQSQCHDIGPKGALTSTPCRNFRLKTIDSLTISFGQFFVSAGFQHSELQEGLCSSKYINESTIALRHL